MDMLYHNHILGMHYVPIVIFNHNILCKGIFNIKSFLRNN